MCRDVEGSDWQERHVRERRGVLRLAFYLGDDGAGEGGAGDFDERLIGWEGAEDEGVAADLHSAVLDEMPDGGGEEGGRQGILTLVGDDEVGVAALEARVALVVRKHVTPVPSE